MLIEDQNHRVELEQNVQNASDRVISLLWKWLHRVDSFSGTKKFWFDRKRQIGFPSSSQRKHLSPQLTSQVRSHKDLQGINWKICKELDAENAERKEIRRSRWSFFWKGKTHMHETNARGNTRELHLELVGDNVTYVRVYWLRSQVRSLDHRSYSSCKLNGITIFRLSILMYSHLVELLWLMTWSKASLRWNNIPWVVVLILLM